MFRFEEIAIPKSLSEACELLTEVGSVPVSGGLFLRLAKAKCRKVVDLSELGLDFIKKNGDSVEIGATTPLRKIELETASYFDGALSIAASHILGVQFRNLATIGGAVMAKHGFSNLITVLLGLDAKLVFASGKIVSLLDFIENKVEKELLEKIVVEDNFDKVSFQLLQHTSLDIAVLNVCTAKKGKEINISVGARPQIAVRAKLAEKKFAESGDILTAAKVAVEEIQFGKDVRGSGEYRKALAGSLIEKAILEVSK